MNLKHLTYRFAHDYAGGITRLADEMGKGAQVLTNKLNPNTETHHVTINELEIIGDFTGNNLRIAEYFAQKQNAVVVALPATAVTGDMGLLDGFMEAISFDGDFAYTFKKAWEDGRVTEQEFAALEKIQYDSIGKRLALLAEIKRLVR